jgi:hypothetical protein
MSWVDQQTFHKVFFRRKCLLGQRKHTRSCSKISMEWIRHRRRESVIGHGNRGPALENGGTPAELNQNSVFFAVHVWHFLAEIKLSYNL